MKANELMIGDYVKFLGRVRKIKSIVRKDTGAEISFEGKNPVVVSLDEIEPIPLTPEILEKNGFARDEIAGWRFRQYEDVLGLIYEIYWNNKGDELEIVSNLAKIGGFDKKGIQFVHQLQHAIRLCGIEKEIEL